MSKLESMKKKRSDWSRKINKIQNDVNRMKSLGDRNSIILKLNLGWLNKANKALSELNNEIKLEEMKSQ